MKIHNKVKKFVAKPKSEKNAKKALENWREKEVFRIGKFLFLSKTEAAKCFRTDEELNLVIDYLVAHNACDISTTDDVIYIKLHPNQTDGIKFEEQDMNLLKLHILNRTLLQQTNDLEKSISDLRRSIKVLLGYGSRSQAKLQLKRMKRNQGTLEKKLTILDNIDIILQTIESASEEADVVNAYKLGLKALKTQLDRTNTVDETVEIVEDIKYYVDQVHEISDAVSGESVFDSVDLLSDAELNEELETLLTDERRKSDYDEHLVRALNDLKVADDDPYEAEKLSHEGEHKKLNISSPSPDCS